MAANRSTRKRYPYETTDIAFAASLLCSGKKLVDTVPTGYGSEVAFAFEDDGDIDGLHAQFINGDLRIDPHAFNNYVKTLKATARGKV